MRYYMSDYPEETEAKYISVAQEFITGKDSVMTDMEKKEWTAEKLYKAAKDKKALQAYIDYQTGLKKAEDKAAYEKESFSESSKLWNEEFGDRFPIASDPDEEQKKNIALLAGKYAREKTIKPWGYEL